MRFDFIDVDEDGLCGETKDDWFRPVRGAIIFISGTQYRVIGIDAPQFFCPLEDSDNYLTVRVREMG